MQEGTTSSEFVEWCHYLNVLEFNRKTPEAYYLAQIAAEIRATSGQGTKVEDFLIRFERKKEDTRTPEERARQSEWRWGAWLTAHQRVEKDKKGKKGGK